jgi:carbon-monoxide dehydrogenase medium subunit
VLRPFELHQPASIEAASRLRAQLGDDSAFYAGGTELLLVMKEGLLRYGHLIDLKTIPGMDAIEYDGERRALRIGALATHAAIERAPIVHERFPLLAEVERTVANVRVKNVGTIGGNLCFAEPHADPGTLFLACDAAVRLRGASASREIPIGEFFRDAYETARAPDEILDEIRVPVLGPHTRGAYMKFGFHERPTLGVALVLTLDPRHESVEDVRVAMGCIHPCPTRLRKVEDRARGRPVREVLAALDEVAAAADGEVSATTDLHGSAEYKQEMVKVFVRRAFRSAAARFNGGGR